jgi:hypothetical protein
MSEQATKEPMNAQTEAEQLESFIRRLAGDDDQVVQNVIDSLCNLTEEDWAQFQNMMPQKQAE